MIAEEKVYLLDTNVFIQAKNQYYSFQICPGFWESLILENAEEAVFSIDRVKAELLKGNDDLMQWVEDTAPGTFFKETDNKAVIECFTKIMEWVQSEPQYNDSSKAEFADGADPWLIAYAKVNGSVLVTHESLAADAKNKIPIPNVCVNFNVKYTHIFEMLETQETRFVLPGRTSRPTRTLGNLG